MSDCSAIPRYLIDYALWGRGANGQIAAQAQALAEALDAFRASGPDPRYIGTVSPLDRRVSEYARLAAVIDDWVGRVGEAFKQAGQGAETTLVFADAARIRAVARTEEDALAGDDATLAATQAQSLREAMSHQNPDAGRRRIEQILRGLEDHRDDPVYVHTFFALAGSQLAAMAGVLHQWDGGERVLSATDEQILRGFGRSLASAASQDLLTVPTTIRAFTRAPNLWSSAMLFHYVDGETFGDAPHGQGTELLAAMARTVLDHLHDGRLNPPVVRPANWSFPDHMDAQRLLAEFNGATAVLATAAQNPAAARMVLGGPGGRPYAQKLDTYSWEVPPYARQVGGRAGVLDPMQVAVPAIDISRAAADFMLAATSARRGADDAAKLAAQAVVNLVDGLPPVGEKNVPRSMRSALLDIMNRYRFDLGIAATVSDPRSAVLPWTLHGLNGPRIWIAHLSSNSLETLMAQALPDPASLGRYIFSMRMAIARAAVCAFRTHMNPDAQALVKQQSALLGAVQLAENDMRFGTAQKADAEAAAMQMWDSIGQNAAWVILSSIVPGTEVGIRLMQRAGEAVGKRMTTRLGPEVAGELLDATTEPAIVDSFSTGHASLAIEENTASFRNLRRYIWIPIVNALIANKLIPVPDQDPAELVVKNKWIGELVQLAQSGIQSQQ